jgi:hypothetical protein
VEEAGSAAVTGPREILLHHVDDVLFNLFSKVLRIGAGMLPITAQGRREKDK